MRRPIVAGNWKMNKSVGEAIDLANAIHAGVDAAPAHVDVVLCPPFTSLGPVGDRLRHGRVMLGAQNLHWEPAGAFTGEVSAPMLRELGCEFVIIGHSERRSLFHESDENVRSKTRSAVAAGLTPIVCVGETLAQREAGETEAVLLRQFEVGLADLAATVGDVVLAYEPVWAIGTGRTATADQAQSAHAFLRGLIRKAAGAEVAERLRIQYGGSVKPENAAELFRQPDVDGGLIGGASLDPESFLGIVLAAGPVEP